MSRSRSCTRLAEYVENLWRDEQTAVGPSCDLPEDTQVHELADRVVGGDIRDVMHLCGLRDRDHWIRDQALSNQNALIDIGSEEAGL